METNNEAIKLKGVKSPNYEEPKGTAYYQLMRQLHVDFIQARNEISEARSKINDLDEEIRDIERKINSENENIDKFHLRKKISELRKNIKPLEEKAYQNIDKLKENIINNEDLAKARAEAIEENKIINQEIKEYQKCLEKAYQATMRDIQRFTAGYRSESKYREADAMLNRLKN